MTKITIEDLQKAIESHKGRPYFELNINDEAFVSFNCMGSPKEIRFTSTLMERVNDLFTCLSARQTGKLPVITITVFQGIPVVSSVYLKGENINENTNQTKHSKH